MIIFNKLLKMIYNFAEKTYRINIEIQKLFDKKYKYNEL